MRKKVNVYPVIPVLNIRNPINNTVLNTELAVGDILCCIYARAKVEEVLPNGTFVTLNLKNYNKCNYLEEHIGKKEESLTEDTKVINTTEVLKEDLADEKDSSDIIVDEIPEAISPEEVQVEENLVVDRQVKKNKRR